MEIEVHDEMLSDESVVYNVDLIIRIGDATRQRIELYAISKDAAYNLAEAVKNAVATYTTMAEPEILDCCRYTSAT